jgi:hypothetical protein
MRNVAFVSIVVVLNMVQDTRPCPSCKEKVRLDAKFCSKCGKQLPPPVDIFISYTREDEPLRDELVKHLSMMRREGLVTLWYDRMIVPGAEWEGVLDERLDRAKIILLLVSPSFVASDYCYEVEMERAMERHKKHEAVVIPIILRPVDWSKAPFRELQGLPRDVKPVTKWSDRDEAFLDVAKGIRQTIKNLKSRIP